MATTGFVVVWIAVSAGTSPSTVWNVADHSPLMALTTSFKTMAEETPTYTKQVRLKAFAKESTKESSVWELMLGTVLERHQDMLTLGGTP